MSNILKSPAKYQLLTPTWEELLKLSTACIKSTARLDLIKIADEHVHDFTANPNSFRLDQLLDQGEISTRSDMVYRKIGAKALKDLASYGIVRNELTAKAHTPREWGHTVGWTIGQDDKFINAGRQAVLETTVENAEQGWVTADKLTALYLRLPHANVENIIDPTHQLSLSTF